MLYSWYVQKRGTSQCIFSKIYSKAENFLKCFPKHNRVSLYEKRGTSQNVFQNQRYDQLNKGLLASAMQCFPKLETYSIQFVLPATLNCCSCTVWQEICATVQLLSRLVSDLQLKLHYVKNQPESRTTTATKVVLKTTQLQ